MARTKHWKGNPPPAGEGWEKIGRLADSTGLEWLVFCQEQGTGWVTLKVVADGRVSHKANFWVAWSYDEHRLCANKDGKLLNAHHAEIYRQLEKFMCDRSIAALV